MAGRPLATDLTGDGTINRGTLSHQSLRLRSVRPVRAPERWLPQRVPSQLAAVRGDVRDLGNSVLADPSRCAGRATHGPRLRANRDRGGNPAAHRLAPRRTEALVLPVGTTPAVHHGGSRPAVAPALARRDQDLQLARRTTRCGRSVGRRGHRAADGGYGADR